MTKKISPHSFSGKMKPIVEIARNIGLDEKDLILYGTYKAKISQNIIDNAKNNKKGKLVLVTATNPTPTGEGKTTVSIGLAQGLNKLSKKAIVALREPSLGPVFGMKGGATGGGKASVLPEKDINLHFTGDMHAITTANNLICSIVDNHIYHGNLLGLDPRRIMINRVMDMNDRYLRNIVIGLGGVSNGTPREESFSISVASELMAVLCLAEDRKDFEKRLSNMIIGYTYDKKEVFLSQLFIKEAIMDLLNEALLPNIVQTTYNTPAIIHGGPFANIAHGCSSVIATKTALSLAEYCITEAGFGSDLGAQKFLDIKCRQAKIKPDAIVIVSTIRSLKYNAYISMKDITIPNEEAVKIGLLNLLRHINNMQKYNIPVLVALNKRTDEDTDGEIEIVKKACEKINVDFEITTAFSDGEDGAVELAKKVILACDKKSELKLLYNSNLSPIEKIEVIAKEIYGAKTIKYTKKAKLKLSSLDSKYHFLPICIAKTPYSFTDDKNVLGAPTDFEITITDMKLSYGAAFIIAYCGDVMTMPGLPKKPAAIKNDDMKSQKEIFDTSYDFW